MKPQNRNEYWACRLCHSSLSKPRDPFKFVYNCNATSGAITHPENVHRVGPHGQITVEQSQLSNGLGGQQSIHGFYTPSTTSSDTSFDAEAFKGLLTELFTTEQIAFVKVESPVLRKLLTYLQPRCRAAIPTRNTLRSYITSAYSNAITTVQWELQQASTKMRLSFNLRTSPGRQLPLLGVVARYLD